MISVMLFVRQQLCQKIFFFQGGFNLVQNVFLLGRYMMKMVAGGDVQKRSGLSGSQIVHKPLHITPVFNIQRSGHLSIDTVVDHHIQNAAAHIYNSSQLLLCLIIAVADLEQPDCLASFRI